MSTLQKFLRCHTLLLTGQLGQDSLHILPIVVYLGMQWDGSIFINTVLPFGLRSAPKIFSALADTLEWIFRHNKVSHILHYLDDFYMAGPAHTLECKNASRHDHLFTWLPSSCRRSIITASFSRDFAGLSQDRDEIA